MGLTSLNSFQEKRSTTLNNYNRNFHLKFLKAFSSVIITEKTLKLYFPGKACLLPSCIHNYMDRDNNTFMEHIIGAHPCVIPQLNNIPLQINTLKSPLLSKTVLLRIISIVHVPSLFSNEDYIRIHDDEL